MAFGYEVLISPLQTLMLYNAVANDGKMMKPYLVNAVQKNGLIVTQNEPVVLEDPICSEETLSQLKTCLEGVIKNGTGKTLQNPFYTLAGKTGTALVANGNRGYADHIYQSSFAGYFPADKPQYSCIVVIKNRPHAKKYYGAAVAGPVFKEIADKLTALHVERGEASTAKNVKRDSSGFYYAGYTEDVKYVLDAVSANYVDSTQKSNFSSMYANEYRTVLNSRTVKSRSIPNVKGLGLKDALYLLENLKMSVVAKGKGKVVMQSLEPGTALMENQTIIIELN